MMFIWIRQHLINNWRSIHEKVKQHCRWVERKGCFYKRRAFNTVVEVHSSILRSTGSQFIFLKLDGLIWPQGEGSKQTGMYLFWAICNLVFMALLKRGFFFFKYKWLQLDKTENVLPRDNQKRDKKIQRKHISHCSLK